MQYKFKKRLTLSKKNESQRWWLRSIGYSDECAACVNYNGWIDHNGGIVCVSGNGVRPALWINIEV